MKKALVVIIVASVLFFSACSNKIYATVKVSQTTFPASQTSESSPSQTEASTADNTLTGDWAPLVSQEEWIKSKGPGRLLLAYQLSQRLQFGADGNASLTNEFNDTYKADGNKAIITIKKFDETGKAVPSELIFEATGDSSDPELRASDGRIFARPDSPRLKWVKEYLEGQNGKPPAADAADAASVNIKDIYLREFNDKKPFESKESDYIENFQNVLGGSYKVVDEQAKSNQYNVYIFTSADTENYGAIYYISSDRYSFNGTIKVQKNNTDFLNDNLAACILSTDDMLALSDAKKLAEQLLDSYTDRARFSGFLVHDGYRLQLSPEHDGRIDISVCYGYEWVDPTFIPTQ